MKSAFTQDCLVYFEQGLGDFLQNQTYVSGHLREAILYAVFNGGKRLRPLLVFAAVETLGAKRELALMPAIAVELIHCYSLIHDDLPAMDNADFRRGSPSCHKAFDEATAILAGDALQALAFEVLSQQTQTYSLQQNLSMIQCVAHACGPHGMAEGQAMDLVYTGQAITLSELTQLHHLKTGKLISACLELACIAAQCSNQTLKMALSHYAEHVGLAFQVMDDILDITSDPKLTGKPHQQDLMAHKTTFPTLLGLEGAKTYAKQLIVKALEKLSPFKLDNSPLHGIAHFVVERST